MILLAEPFHAYVISLSLMFRHTEKIFNIFNNICIFKRSKKKFVSKEFSLFDLFGERGATFILMVELAMLKWKYLFLFNQH